MLKMAQQSSNRHLQILKYKIHFLWLLEKQFLVHTPYNYGVFAAAKSSPLFAKSRAAIQHHPCSPSSFLLWVSIYVRTYVRNTHV